MPKDFTNLSDFEQRKANFEVRIKTLEELRAIRKLLEELLKGRKSKGK